MWLIELLTTEALQKKPVYFKEVFKECDLPFMEPSDELTFEQIKSARLGEFREKITDVSMKADKKWNIEKKINEMIDKAKETKLDIMGYKSTYILFKLDEIQLNLDDQSNILGMMKSNPFIKAVQNKANSLENKLLLI